MLTTILELTGAFIIWMFKGFKGKYSEMFKTEANYSYAFLGLVSIIATVFLAILINYLINL